MLTYKVFVQGDEELLQAWRKGSRAAGDELIARHFDALHRFFDGKLAESAEDLVQRTLLDCVESRAAVRDGNFRAYLFGIARHRLIDHLRGKLRGGNVLDIDQLSLADLATSPSQALARNQDEQLLHAALRRLSIDQQVALELTYWEGLSGREVAEVLGVDPSTVRSRLLRAREALRHHLAELGAGADTIERTLSQLGDGR